MIRSQVLQGDTVNYIAKWGGTQMDICVSNVLGVEAGASFSENIKLSPNPTNSNFTLTLPPSAGACTIRIRDIAGREVMPAQAYRAGDGPVDVSALPAGLYLVEAQMDGQLQVIKLLKE